MIEAWKFFPGGLLWACGRDPDPWGAAAQPEEHRRRYSAGETRGDHGAERVGEIVAGVSHAVCRGAAALCGIAVGLCAAVSRSVGEAGCRFDRGAEPGDRDRAAGRRAEPALDGGDGDRDPRLPAGAVGGGGDAARSGDGRAAGADERGGHRERAGGAGGGDEGDVAGAGAEGGAGRAGAVVRRSAAAGIRPGAGGRRGAGNRGGGGEVAGVAGGGGDRGGSLRGAAGGGVAAGGLGGNGAADLRGGGAGGGAGTGCGRVAGPCVSDELIGIRGPGFMVGELSPKHFSFNSHLGACEACEGLGTEMFCDPGLLVAIRAPRMRRWTRSGEASTAEAKARGDQRGGSWRSSWRTGGVRGVVSGGSWRPDGRSGGEDAEDRSKASRAKAEKIAEAKASSGGACAGDGASAVSAAMAAAQAGVAGGEDRGGGGAGWGFRISASWGGGGDRWLEGSGCRRTGGGLQTAGRATCGRGLAFLEEVGLDYLTLRSHERHALRRRGAAHPAGDPARRGSVRRDLRAGRAEHRAARGGHRRG